MFESSVRAYWLSIGLLVLLPIVVGIIIGHLTAKAYSQH